MAKKNRALVRFGKWLMKNGALRIEIADDEDAYFTPKMLSAASNAGFSGIVRHRKVMSELLEQWLAEAPHIIILDVRNVCDAVVARDGIELARTLVKETSAMVVLTSSHKWHLRKDLPKVDYFIENRQMTSVDFVDEIATIVDIYLETKSRFYKNVLLKVGIRAARMHVAS